MFDVAAIRAYLRVESDAPVTFYTAKLVKTLLYSLVKELRLYRGMRGVISPLHISPLFRPGRREWELGELETPSYVREGGNYRLRPAHLDGEYIIHVGGMAELVSKASAMLEQVRTPLQIKIGDNIIRVRLEKAEDVTRTIKSKELHSDRLTLYLKGPAKLFNIYTPARLPKYSISAPEVLMTPYMLHKGQLTMNEGLLLEAARLLGLLVETYYSITTVRYVQVPLNNGKDPGLLGKITYIVDTEHPAIKKEIAEVLNVAEIAGIGESRTNGFGIASWKPKQ